MLEAHAPPDHHPGPPSSLDAPERDSPKPADVHGRTSGGTPTLAEIPPAAIARFESGCLSDSPSLASTFRHSGWANRRRKVYEALCRTGQTFPRRTEFAGCGNHAYVLRSTTEPITYRVAGSSCHDRFCLPCAAERSNAIKLNVLERIGINPVRFLTLTIKSAQEPLTELLDKLYSSFQSLRRRTLWTKAVTGGVAFLEVKWSARAQRWHPHFHVLIQGRYLPQKPLAIAWLDITGDSHVVDIRAVRDLTHTAYYVTKYASKPLDNSFLDLPDQLDEAILALKGRKLCLTFGTWRGVLLARTIAEGAWENIGPLEDFIFNAAHGDPAALETLAFITNRDLTDLYSRAPPLAPAPTPQQPIETQLSFHGTWTRSSSFVVPGE